MAEHKTVMIGETKYHLPYLDLIPMDPQQDGDLRRSLQESGKVEMPIIANKAKSKPGNVWVVDGAHRVIHASNLSLDPPKVIYRTFADDEEEADFAWMVNADRRQMTPQQLEKGRRERHERIAARKAQGESNRAVAEAEGVSEATVRRVAKRSGASHDAPESKPLETKGKDGKTYSATAPIICKRCKRLSKPIDNCKQCIAARKESAKKKAAAKRRKEAAAEAEQKVDCFKTPVPAKRCDALFDPWIQNGIDFLARVSEQFRTERLGEVMHKKAKHYPFFDPKDFGDGCGFVMQYLDDLREHLKMNRPEAVCPKCNGEGCGSCKMSGLVPRTVHAQLKESAGDSDAA